MGFGSEGFSAALKFWIIFLLLFFALGYPPIFSIMLGAIAALAGGYIVTHWTTKNQTPPKTTPKQQEEEGPIGLRERTLQRRQRQAAKQPIQVPPFLNRFFPRRKPIPNFKTRRENKP